MNNGNPAQAAQAAAAAAAAAAAVAAQQHQHQMALHQQAMAVAVAQAAAHQHHQQHHPQHHQQMVNLMTTNGMQPPPSPTSLMNMSNSTNMLSAMPTLMSTSTPTSTPHPLTTSTSTTPTNKPSRKRRVEGHGNLTVEQKRRICEKHRSTPKITQKDLCRWAKLEFNLKKGPTQPTMSNILKNEHLFKDAIGGVLGAERKTIRPTKHAHFDQVLANWVMERQNKGTITGDMIKQRGRDLAKQMGLEGKLGFSNGWLASFKARHGLVKRAATLLPGDGRGMTMNMGMNMNMGLGGNETVVPPSNTNPDGLMEPSHVPHTQSTEPSPPYVPYPVSMDMSLEQIQDVLREYVPSDIYTVDETGLFYRASPSKLVQGDEAQALLHDEGKLSVLLATNADATDLMEPYIIGSLVAPRHIKNASTAQLGYHYVTSSRSRMTVFIFQQWLRDFNVRMASAHRYVVLLMDNAPSHVLGCVHLTNVRVIMFAPHLGMKIQPMRGGILQAFKGKYRLKHLTLAIDHLEDGLSDIYRVTQLQAMKWITEAWQQVSKEVIIQAWKPLGLQIVFPFDTNNTNDSGQDDKNVEEELWGLLYCLQLSGVVNTKMLVNNRWENDIHKRLNEDMIEDPQENDMEFQIPDPMVTALTVGNSLGGNVHHSSYSGNPHDPHMGLSQEEQDTLNTIHSLTAKEQLKAFRDVIRFLERTGAGTMDPHMTSVIEYLKKKQLTLRFDNASSSSTLTM